MFFSKKKQQEEDRAISLRELEDAIAKYLNEQRKTNPNISYHVLFDENGNISYEMLKKFLPFTPTNQYVGTRNTFEFFEDTPENRRKVYLIDHVQEALDEYVIRKEAFPVKETSKELEICYLKLQPFLKDTPEFPLYLLPDYYLVNSEPK